MYRASTLALIGMYTVGFIILIFASTFPLGVNPDYVLIVGFFSGVELILYDLFKSLKQEEQDVQLFIEYLGPTNSKKWMDNLYKEKKEE